MKSHLIMMNNFALTATVKFIDSNTSLTLESAIGSSDVSTAKIVTRQRGQNYKILKTIQT